MAHALALDQAGTLDQLERDLLAAHPGENEYSLRFRLIGLFERLAETFDQRGNRPAAKHCAVRAVALYEEERIHESAGAGGAAALRAQRDAEARLRRYLG